MIFFLLKDDLAKMSGAGVRIHGDGTFRSVAFIPGYYQCFTLSIKITSQDKSRAMPYPLVEVLMPNRQKKTYKDVWEVLKLLHEEHFGVPLKIEQFSCDMVSDSLLFSIFSN